MLSQLRIWPMITTGINEQMCYQTPRRCPGLSDNRGAEPPRPVEPVEPCQFGSWRQQRPTPAGRKSRSPSTEARCWLLLPVPTQKEPQSPRRPVVLKNKQHEAPGREEEEDAPALSWRIRGAAYERAIALLARRESHRQTCWGSVFLGLRARRLSWCCNAGCVCVTEEGILKSSSISQGHLLMPAALLSL